VAALAWRYDSNSPCSAAARSDLGLVPSIASSGCGSRSDGHGGARRLRNYFRYYHASRTHLALDKDAPEPRAVEPPDQGRIVALPLVGGLHHRYVRSAA
jgi:hypothetical protein